MIPVYESKIMDTVRKKLEELGKWFSEMMKKFWNMVKDIKSKNSRKKEEKYIKDLEDEIEIKNEKMRKETEIKYQNGRRQRAVLRIEMLLDNIDDYFSGQCDKFDGIIKGFLNIDGIEDDINRYYKSYYDTINDLLEEHSGGSVLDFRKLPLEKYLAGIKKTEKRIKIVLDKVQQLEFDSKGVIPLLHLSLKSINQYTNLILKIMKLKNKNE